MADDMHTPSVEGIAARQPGVVSCWMCGIHLHNYQMVPDGDSACQDTRWYCKDTRACTERWTSSPRQMPAAGAA